MCALIAGQRGWEAIERNPSAPRESILSLVDVKHIWIDGGRSRLPFYCHEHEMRALQIALAARREEGIDACVRRHRQARDASRDGIRALALAPWIAADALAAQSSRSLPRRPVSPQPGCCRRARPRFPCVSGAAERRTRAACRVGAPHQPHGGRCGGCSSARGSGCARARTPRAWICARPPARRWKRHSPRSSELAERLRSGPSAVRTGSRRPRRECASRPPRYSVR